jgi:hypothetical protein
MIQAFGNLSLVVPSHFQAVHFSRNVSASQCVVRSDRRDNLSVLQQRWECQCQCQSQSQVVRNGRIGSGNGTRSSARAQSYSSGAKASSVSEEEACVDVIDPGLLSRVAKVYRPAVLLPVIYILPLPNILSDLSFYTCRKFSFEIVIKIKSIHQLSLQVCLKILIKNLDT